MDFFLNQDLNASEIHLIFQLLIQQALQRANDKHIGRKNDEGSGSRSCKSNYVI